MSTSRSTPSRNSRLCLRRVSRFAAFLIFESEINQSALQVNDPDAILTVVKASLKTSNNHLTAAAVSVLPAFLPLILSRSVNHHHGVTPSTSSSTSSTAPSSVIDVPLLRHVLNQLLPSGGILDRLGDKERVQAKAREALVVLGGFAFRSGGSSSLSSRSTSGKGVETPLMIFERHLKEGGLKSKVWKIREQVSMKRLSTILPSLRANPGHPHPCSNSTRPSPLSHSTVFSASCRRA